MSEAYKAAGVDLQLGDELSQMLYEASKQTWVNREGKFGEPTSAVDSFRGLRDMSIAPLLNAPEPEGIRMYICDDGVGTKVEVAERRGKHDTIAFDLLAMVVDDAAIKGYEPAAVSTTLDVRKLDESMKPEMEQLARGYVLAANAARVALVNGEVAELGDLVGGFGDGLVYNWSATLLYAGHQSRLLDGRAVRPGDALVGFQENGFRSNGLSLVRKTLQKNFGNSWQEQVEEETDWTWSHLVLQPSTIYSPVLVDAIGGYDLSQPSLAEVHGAAHITGGGMPGKLGGLLKTAGVGAVISEPFETPYVMKSIQRLADIPDEEAYHVWNMGTGMVVATPEPEKLIDVAARHNVAAKQIGEVISAPMIVIADAQKPGRDLTFRLNS
ncbi:MAG: AIR synthase-related protein [Candidatus Saccharimonadales bacterium]